MGAEFKIIHIDESLSFGVEVDKLIGQIITEGRRCCLTCKCIAGLLDNVETIFMISEVEPLNDAATIIKSQILEMIEENATQIK